MILASSRSASLLFSPLVVDRPPDGLDALGGEVTFHGLRNESCLTEQASIGWVHIFESYAFPNPTSIHQMLDDLELDLDALQLGLDCPGGFGPSHRLKVCQTCVKNLPRYPHDRHARIHKLIHIDTLKPQVMLQVPRICQDMTVMDQ